MNKISTLKLKQYQKRKKHIRRKQNKKVWKTIALLSLFLGSILVSVIIAIVSSS